MKSILEGNELTIEKFEGAIAIGSDKADILEMFNVSPAEIDKWCLDNYGRCFNTAYNMIKQCVYVDFLTTVKELGYRGNPSALNIINEAIRKKNNEKGVVKIVFENTMSLESDDDKKAGND